MELGITMFPTDEAIRIDRLARELEDRGFDALFVSEHTHIPVEHTPYPGGGDLPREYFRTGDPMVALAYAAAVTERLRIGTGICLVCQHDPIVLAKQVATLDHLSGGRFEFGVGYGWNRPELEHHGVAFADRREALRERVLAMRALWTQEQAEFHGEHVDFAPSYLWPKPIQEGGPPVLLGASPGETTRAQIAEFCDGWMPIGASGLSEEIPRMRQAFEDAGRDGDDLQVQVFGGGGDQDKLEYLAGLGVDRVLFWIPHVPEAQAMERLEELTELKEQIGW